jgi:thymidylate synthase (FAD)
MNATDQQKLIKAGFVLVRPDDHPSPRIKVKDDQSSEWRTMERFDSKATRDRELKRLLKSNLIIQDYMKLIQPYFEILSEIDGISMLKSIERAGRTCYKSEDKITEGSAEKFVQMLINRGHESVLEHEKISVLFVCDRGVSHEIVRHRIASFSQESTRYCNYSRDGFGKELTFIIPPFEDDGTELRSDEEIEWRKAMQDAERHYMNLIKVGWQPQYARSVLPNSLKTEIVVTANIREWRTILKQRTSKAAHPQMRQLMCPLLDRFKRCIPIIFNDIQRRLRENCKGW